MKDMFPEYDDTSSLNFEAVWKEAFFIFDTNVLLNLYRYQITTRDELISVLEKLSEKIWIPHHVALEFQKNRQVVIADQNKRFSEVRDVVEKARKSLINDLDKLQLKKRHSVINPDPFLGGLNGLIDNFLVELESSQKTQQQLTGPDALKQKLETLFDGKVGLGPRDQIDIDIIYKSGEQRFKLNRPPGFKDAAKDKDQPDEHFHGGITYKRKYGDYLIWTQVLAHAKNIGAETLIFVSDDGKDDWWARVGNKTVGPRPELIDEARHLAGVKTLLMYSLENFLNLAKTFLKAEVSDETLKEVRDVSVTSSRDDSNRRHQNRRREALALLVELLKPDYEHILKDNFWPDIIALKGGQRYAFELIEIKGISKQEITELLKQGELSLHSANNIEDHTLVLLVDNEAHADLVAEKLLKIPESERAIKDVYIMIVAIMEHESIPNSLMVCWEFGY